jgi:2-oxoglutarate dehydrogenase E2 component (dihydrolipoamide succinyltransferase)
MAKMDITLPAMGEGVIEATISKWLVSEGAQVKEDDPLVEVATDKVDSEIPSPVSGTVVSVNVKEGSIAKIGEILAVIETEAVPTAEDLKKVDKEVEKVRETINADKKERVEIEAAATDLKSRTPSGKFLSPLVRNIAAHEGISYDELDTIKGTGMDGRITKDDVMKFLAVRTAAKEPEKAAKPAVTEQVPSTEKEVKEPETAPESRAAAELQKTVAKKETALLTKAPGDEVIPMDRIRKLIADHMVMSKRTSPHVTSFIDADVTKLVNWRNANKDKFLASEGQKLTLTPIFLDAIAKALHEIPMVNISVEGDNIIKRKNINIGMATALPDGNLIVPVIKNANEKSITGLAKAVNDLAERARMNKLKPDEITGGTFTLTNYGSYSNLAGTPIINQPQAAILGTGVVKKTPVVIETEEGDVIAIRQIMILSLSYDHRVIDGALAGKFLQKMKNILENYSPDPI